LYYLLFLTRNFPFVSFMQFTLSYNHFSEWENMSHIIYLFSSLYWCGVCNHGASIFFVRRKEWSDEESKKQLKGFSFLDKRKATKPKLATDQIPCVSAVPPDADQVIVPVLQQGVGDIAWSTYDYSFRFDFIYLRLLFPDLILYCILNYLSLVLQNQISVSSELHQLFASLWCQIR
jgi:hypothetical protein